jgi:Domain of unknown function (DUF5658)
VSPFRAGSREYLALAALLIVLNLADAAFTLVATRYFGGVELNPLMRLCLHHGPVFFFVTKMSISTFFSFIGLFIGEMRMNVRASKLFVLVYSLLVAYEAIGIFTKFI